MKEWCLEHPYLAFFIAMSMIATTGNVLMKIVGLFVKPPPTILNMNIDPEKLASMVQNTKNIHEEDGSLH